MKPRRLSSTCSTWAEMPFEVPKTYGRCSSTSTGKCYRNSSSRQRICVGARVIPGPSGLPLTPFFFPRTAGKERLWPASEQQLFPLQQVAWRKVLTRPQTVGLSTQRQSTSNSFKDKQMDLKFFTENHNTLWTVFSCYLRGLIFSLI